MCEEGLLVGSSAGTAVAAALRFKKSPVVALLPDNRDRYFIKDWIKA
jgi:cysteine synthase